MIGGYAVNAYGPLRYSDDVDIVLSTASADATRGWLKSQGLRLVEALRTKSSKSLRPSSAI